MQNRVLETLNQYEDTKFFAVFESEESDKESDKKKSGEKAAFTPKNNEAGEIAKEAKSIINKANTNWKEFLLVAKDSDKDLFTSFFKQLKTVNSSGEKVYALYDSPFSIVCGNGRLMLQKNNNAFYDVECSPEIAREFSQFLSSIIQQGSEFIKSQGAAKRKAKLELFLAENMNTDEYLSVYYDGVAEALEGMGYTYEEADFIMGEASTDILEELAAERTNPIEAAKRIAGIAIRGLKESHRGKLNEGLDPAILDYLIGAVGVFITAGLITKLQSHLAKNKNPKVQAFAKALSIDAAAKSTSTSKLDSHGYVKENKIATGSKLNEDASLVDLVPYIAGTLGTFIAAFGINALQKAMAQSKNKKIRRMAQNLEKLGTAASEARQGKVKTKL